MAHDARDSAAHGYPQPLSRAGQVEPVPRRIRAALDGRTVLDTTRALYLWEWPFYPRYLIPADAVDAATLVDEGRRHRVSRGTVARVGLRVGESYRAGAGRRYEASPLEALVGMIAFDWDALDEWYEEDERVFVHPRNPYVRVDALRSSRRVRVEKDGVVLAESAATVMVFETGLPTRYYFDRTAVDFSHLVASETVTACPYKGRTSAYWSVRAGGTEYPDLAWCYDFPTGQLRPIAGLVAFYDERVDVFIDGVEQPQPTTHFFDADSR